MMMNDDDYDNDYDDDDDDDDDDVMTNAVFQSGRVSVWDIFSAGRDCQPRHGVCAGRVCA